MPEIAVHPSSSESLVDVAAETVARVSDPLLARARARVGTTLRNKWQLDALLGVGGMAAVYEGTHRNGSRAAVKVLHVELSLHPDARARFLREGYVANAVGHDGAVRVIDDDVSEDGSLFLVTELLRGETLEDRRVRFGGKLAVDDVLGVVDQLLDVLATAHAKGVVHRDLKPENVYLTLAGQVKVLDFGIARLRELSAGTHATKTGATMGTPDFMPPEQARGLWDEVDGRSDLWAVGATMFSLLSGRSVHEGRTANEVLLSAMTRQAPPLAAVMPGVSSAIAEVLDRALAFDRNARWADARAMQAAVRRAYEDRHGAPITLAPRLAVPSASAIRTVPSASPATTSGAMIKPVQAASEPPPALSVPVPPSVQLPSLPRSRGPLVAAVFGGAVAMGGLVAVLVLTFAGHPGARNSATNATSAAFIAPEPPPPPGASTLQGTVVAAAAPTTTASGAVAPAPAPPPATVAPTPVVAATDLPSVGRAPRTAPAAKATATHTQATETPHKLNCSPPYVVDPATGKKTWKEECL